MYYYGVRRISCWLRTGYALGYIKNIYNIHNINIHKHNHIISYHQRNHSNLCNRHFLQDKINEPFTVVTTDNNADIGFSNIWGYMAVKPATGVVKNY